MNHDELLFEEFFAARLRDKGISLKRLTELTGIAPSHLEHMLRGNFEDMPSSPYFRGYLIRIGKVLDFDGEEWWGKIRNGGFVKNSGPADALPKNRFVQKDVSKMLLAAIFLAIAITIYLATTLPRITGKPILTITYPPQNPYTTGSSTITLQGTTRDADSLYLNGDEVTIMPGGSWQKGVLLQNGANTFRISAKKFLGGETDVVEQILYQPAVGGPGSASSSVFPTVH